jgi:RNA polymerase sigma-70 factor (ECF subfamily)
MRWRGRERGMEPDRRPGRVPVVDSVLSFSHVDPLAAATPTADTPEASARAVPMTFEEFYRERRDRMARALALTLGDGHLGAEAADEAMARAYQRWDRVAGLDDPPAWVYRVGLNWATSVLRRRHRAPQPHAERGPIDLDPIPEPTIRQALADLDVKQRAVVVCRFYLGLTEAETAAALRIRPGTAKSRLHRALRTLQPRLEHLRQEESR